MYSHSLGIIFNDLTTKADAQTLLILLYPKCVQTINCHSPLAFVVAITYDSPLLLPQLSSHLDEDRRSYFSSHSACPLTR